ncbi:hypothetical protein BDQ17DRAFT_1326494 [Cyathus striatus]|nr:hypothetical protein BDQ17DRAFT_1326494 [Cyathus striatus]
MPYRTGWLSGEYGTGTGQLSPINNHTIQPCTAALTSTTASTTENSDPSICQKHPRDGTRYQELLNTEKLDGSGGLRVTSGPGIHLNHFLPSLEENSDSEGEEEDDGDDVVITNEIAASLPRKLAFKRKHTKEVSRKLVTKLM